MCSIAGDVMLEESSSNRNIKLDTCKKCQTEKPSIILRKTDSYCKNCFLPATVHKFRATLGKYRILKPNEKVLVLYESGHASTALLHFIKSGLDLNTHKRLRIEPIVLFIDDNLHHAIEDRLNRYKKIAADLLDYKFPIYVVSLHSFISKFNELPNIIELNGNINDDDVRKLFGGFNKRTINLSQYEDMINTSRRQLIIEIAKKLQCKVAFTPELSLDVAINLLSNLSLGRGAHLSLDVGVLDDRDPEVKILQPLRYFDMKEIAFYNVFNHLNPIHVDNPKENISTSSVNTLLKKFVIDLQENFPSTIKTVVRTGDKLTINENNGIICRICKAPVEQQDQLSSSEARDFSHWVSTHSQELTNVQNYTNSNLNNNINLCYGCKNLSFLINE